MKKIKNINPKNKICINYDEDFILNEENNFIKNLIELTDIYIFEKKTAINFYDKILNNNNEENEKENNNEKIIENFFLYKLIQKRENKEQPLIKLGIFLDNLEEIILLEQNPKNDLIINNIIKKLNVIPQSAKDDEINEYKELIKNKYTSIKSVYIGSFLNHLFKNEKQDSFNICLKTGIKCTTRYLEIIKFGLDVPSVQKYYEIKIAKPVKKKNK